MPMTNSEHEQITRRSIVRFKPETIRDSDFSVEFVLSNEKPVRVWSWERWEVINETLISSGFSLREGSNGQIPLQDSHDTSTIVSNLGAVREIRSVTEDDGNKIVGRLFFDVSDDIGKRAFEKVKNGFIDSGSIGYEHQERSWIPENEKLAFNGKEYAGPMQLVYRWILLEFSLLAIGADPGAKVRGKHGRIIDQSEDKEGKLMPQEKVNDTQALDAVSVSEARIARLQKEAEEKLAKVERMLVDTQIGELCVRHKLDDLGKELVKAGASLEDAQQRVIDELSKRASNAAKIMTPHTAYEITMGETSGGKIRNAMIDAMMIRGFPTSHGIKDPAAGSELYAHRTLLEIGEECLNAAGIQTRHMTKSEKARKLIESFYTRGVVTDMSTASFPAITESVVGKAAMKGFTSQPSIWSDICSVGSVSDFKTVTRVGLSENADLPLKPEGGEYQMSKFSDRKESGYVSRYADGTALTEEAMVNDDIGILTTIPFRKGAAAMRVPEQLLFAVINTPPTLNASGYAWFSTSNSPNNDMNHADGLTTGNLSDAIARFKSAQPPVHGVESTTDYCDIMPKVLLTHTDEEMTAKIIVNSSSLPQTSMSSGVYNPIKDLNLMTRASSRLTSSTSFYLFADPNLYPVIEMLFLNGRVAPETFVDRLVVIDGVLFRIRMDCGIIVLEHRTALRFRKA